jgi:hypothetical protein
MSDLDRTATALRRILADLELSGTVGYAAYRGVDDPDKAYPYVLGVLEARARDLLAALDADGKPA